MNESSPFDQWLAGKSELHPFVDIARDDVDLEKGVLVVIEKRTVIYDSYRIGKSVFKGSWNEAHKYVKRINESLKGLPKHLDEHQKQELQKHGLDRPPRWSYPLYLIAVSKAGTLDPYLTARSKQLEDEYGPHAKIVVPEDTRLVYVGKKAAGDRFRDGHKAITKLHHPDYREYEKWVYETRVTVKTKAGITLPLEWVRDYRAAERLLLDIESQLIYYFQPELNDDGKANLLSKWTTNFGFVNRIPNSTFLQGSFLFTGVELPQEFGKIGVVDVTQT